MKINLTRISGTVLLALSLPFCSLGQGALQVDQQAGYPASFFSALPITVQGGEPIGQSFTPSLNAVGYIELNMGDANPGNGLGATVSVNLRSGSITGTILGTSAPVTMADGNPNGGYFPDFFFSTPVTVTPGTKYYFDIVVQSGSDSWQVAGYNDYFYSGGNAYYQGVLQTYNDLRFQEGTVVPEPSTAWLALAGGGLFFCFRRWQKSPRRQT